MPTFDPVIKRQPPSKTGWPRPGKIIRSGASAPFGSDRPLEPTQREPRGGCRDHPGNPEDGQVIYCEEPVHWQGGQNSVSALFTTTAPPVGHNLNGDHPHVPRSSQDLHLIQNKIHWKPAPPRCEQTRTLPCSLITSSNTKLRVSRRMSRTVTLPIPYEASEETTELP